MSQYDNWEENNRNREARHSRIQRDLSELDGGFFKCDECSKFLETWMESEDVQGVCHDCILEQKEVTDELQ